MKINCLICKKLFKVRPGYKKYNKKFCSLKCKGDSQKGHIPWNKGMKGLQPWMNITGLRSDNWLGKKRLDMKGENHFAWKGDNGGYRTKHSWIVNNFGQPGTCEHCGKSNLKSHKIHWANKSGNYKRERTDWIRLCAKCHAIYDGNRRRKQIPQLVNL